MCNDGIAVKKDRPLGERYSSVHNGNCPCETYFDVRLGTNEMRKADVV